MDDTKITYRLEADDLLAFHRASVPKRVMAYKGFIATAAIVWCIALCTWLLHIWGWIRPEAALIGHPTSLSFMMLIAAVVYLFIAVQPGRLFAAVNEQSMRKIYAQEAVGDYELEISESGVHHTTRLSKTVYEWDAFSEWVEMPPGLALFLRNNQAVVIPESAFVSEAHRQTFVEQVSGWIGPPED